jgi:hypothetical protein
MDDRQKPTDRAEPTEQGAPRDIPWIDRLTASALVRLL